MIGSRHEMTTASTTTQSETHDAMTTPNFVDMFLSPSQIKMQGRKNVRVDSSCFVEEKQPPKDLTIQELQFLGKLACYEATALRPR